MTIPQYAASQPFQSPYPTDPSDAPVPGISFGGALVRFFQKYARFSGRASRSEFWWMYLWSLILSVVLGLIAVAVMVPAITSLLRSDAFNTETAEAALAASKAMWGMIGGFAVLWVIIAVIELAIVVPWLAMIVRRLHDSNKSGHLAWLLLIPSVGHLIVLILCLMPSEAWGQRFDRPLARA